eukprot:TRINITY_DN5105_c0_g1_i1.p1 TRINITY_DN5105_c0_g1~~TRINITY_DN5105_c0_g1_i1.p1  ORF type:complete len:365 (-),score=95.47 TRINITY_DN5105_c0_g1_i1:50-1144(-)
MFLRLSTADKHAHASSPPMSPSSKAEVDKYDKAIASHMKEWKDEDSKFVKIGVLGTEGSGRLTFITNMRLTAEAAAGDHKAEQESRLTGSEMYFEVMQNLVTSVKSILNKVDMSGVDAATKVQEIASPVSKDSFVSVKSWSQSLSQDEKWNSAVESVRWECFDEYNVVKYWVPKLENLSEDHKFDDQERVMAHSYKIRREHTGFVDYAFNVRGKKLDFSYPHQVKFKKWLPMFLSSVSCVLFFVDVGRICGSSDTDFLQDGVQLYEKTLQNLPKGAPMQIFLVLSKYDLLEQFVASGITTASLSLSGFAGSLSSASEISSYVVDQFKSVTSKYGSHSVQHVSLKNLDQSSVRDLMEKLSNTLHK